MYRYQCSYVSYRDFYYDTMSVIVRKGLKYAGRSFCAGIGLCGLTFGGVVGVFGPTNETVRRRREWFLGEDPAENGMLSPSIAFVEEQCSGLYRFCSAAIVLIEVLT